MHFEKIPQSQRGDGQFDFSLMNNDQEIARVIECRGGWLWTLIWEDIEGVTEDGSPFFKTAALAAHDLWRYIVNQKE